MRDPGREQHVSQDLHRRRDQHLCELHELHDGEYRRRQELRLLPVAGEAKVPITGSITGAATLSFHAGHGFEHSTVRATRSAHASPRHTMLRSLSK